MVIIAPPKEKNQEEKMSRQQKRSLERQRKKLEEKRKKQLKKVGKTNNVEARFDNETVSSNAPFTYLEAYKQVLGLKAILSEHFSMQTHHNKQYPCSELLEQAIDALLIGHSRFYHMQQLKHDPGFKIIKGKERIADESTVRKLFPKMEKRQLENLAKINEIVLKTLVKLLQPQSVWVDFDDTVITVHGEQENSENGN